MHTRHPDEGMEAQLTILRQRHEADIRALEERHTAAINILKTSVTYRVGAIIVDLRRPVGWRRLPSRLRRLAREFRDRSSKAVAVPALYEGPPKSDITAVSILDEFTAACFQPEIRLDGARRGGWHAQLDGADLVLAETAWRGNDGAWKYTMSKFDPDGELQQLLSAARARDVPSILWNKEDPVSFDTFLPLARQFDHVYTTDADIVDRYREELGHHRVHGMMFAAQPAIHNPIGRVRPPAPSACFAGAWRGAKYPERARQLTTLLDAARSTAALTIFDRQPTSYAEGEGFPERFHPYIAGTLPYHQMVGEYRRHTCFLNVNSVTESSTMMSRRVFEILACGTPVVSTPSVAIDTHLSDVVFTPTNFEDAVDIVGRLASDVDARDRAGHLGYRKVMSAHTYHHRLADVFTDIGVERLPPVTTPTVDIICVSNRPEQLDHALDNVRRQLHPATRLIFVANSDRFDRADLEVGLAEFPDSILLELPDELSLGECLDAARERSTAEYFAKFDDDDFYGPNYLADIMLATRFADASIYGKRTFHAYVEAVDKTVIRHEHQEFKFVSFVMGASLVVRRADVAGIRFPAVERGTDTRFQEACVAAGLKIFATDRFNLIAVRHQDQTRHTWKISDQEFMSKCRTLGTGMRSGDVLI